MDIHQFHHRLRPSSNDYQDPISESESDRGRLINSSAFRRLQQKAQVFSLESNAAVRSRLTHSVEVAHVGRYIVSEVVRRFCSQPELEDSSVWKENRTVFSNIVETACLMHDIGNPPFGHFGEYAIVQWFKSDSIKQILLDMFSETEEDKQYDEIVKNICGQDFLRFDGNPQGLRIVSKLQGDDEYGLNLTCQQLLSLIKYPFCTTDDSSGKDGFRAKGGYFSTEKNFVESCWEKANIKDNRRNHFVFLMEAADDISYCISDIEDGIEKEIVDSNSFLKEMKEFIFCNLKDHEHEGFKKLLEKLDEGKDVVSKFVRFKTGLIRLLVNYSAERFVESYAEIDSNEMHEELFSDDDLEGKVLEKLKDFSKSNLFSSKEAESIELAGYSVIMGILEKFTSLIALSQEEFSALVEPPQDRSKESKKLVKGLHIERRLFNLLPCSYVDIYRHRVEEVNGDRYAEINARLHLVIDFVSGMTDDFSMQTYQLLRGIEIKL